jgi:hypothetical protein
MLISKHPDVVEKGVLDSRVVGVRELATAAKYKDEIERTQYAMMELLKADEALVRGR